MKTEEIVTCVVALLLGMLLFHMLTNVCGCKVVEGQEENLPVCGGILRTKLCSNVEDLDKCNEYVETLGGRNRQCGIITDSNYVHPEQLNNIGSCGRIRNPDSVPNMMGGIPIYTPLLCLNQDLYIDNVDPDTRISDLENTIFDPYLECVRTKIFNDDGTTKVENSNEDIKKLVKMGSYNEEGDTYTIPTGSLEECFTNLNKTILENVSISDKNTILSSAPSECRSVANTPPVTDFFYNEDCGLDGAVCDWQDDNTCILNQGWSSCKETYFSDWRNAGADTENRRCYDSLDTSMPIWLENTYDRLYDSGQVTNTLGSEYINYRIY